MTEAIIAAVYFGFWVIGGLAILLLGIFYYDKRYKRRGSADDGRPQRGFHPTPEVFIDPKDGLKYRVWYNPHTGERDYIRET